MVHKSLSDLKDYNKGITLIEIVVVIFIIALFSIILISDFPKMLRQFALSRVTYKLAQDLRKAEDLGLSGVAIKGSDAGTIKAQGYGIYIYPTQSTTKYIIYADVSNGSGGRANQKYDGDFGADSGGSTLRCSNAVSTATTDCIIEVIDISKENPSLSIKSLDNINGNFTSINFSPPNPTVKIDNIDSSSSPIIITIGNTDGLDRTVEVNTSGLISVQ